MFLPYTREEHFFQQIREVSIVIEYLHDAVLNDECHKHILLNVSIHIVSEKQKCYMPKTRKIRFMPQFGKKS